MSLAGQALDEGRFPHLQELLKRHRPRHGTDGGPDDLRGFEWYHLRWCADDRGARQVPPLDPLADCVACSPGGDLLASTSTDGSVKVWPADQPGRVQMFARGSVEPPSTKRLFVPRTTALAFSPDGRRLAASGGLEQGYTVRIYDVRSQTQIHTLSGHPGPVLALAWGQDGEWLAAGCGNAWDPRQPGEIRLWRLAGDRPAVAHRESQPGAVFSVCFIPGQERLSWTYCPPPRQNGAIHIARIRPWKAETELPLSATCYALAVNPKGTRLAAAGVRDKILLWDLPGLKSCETSFEVHSGANTDGGDITDVAFSPDGRRLLSASTRGTLCQYDAETGKRALVTSTASGWITSAVFQEGGRRVICVNRGNGHWVVNAAPQLKGPGTEVRALAFDANGKTLAVGSGPLDSSKREKGRIELWSTGDWRMILDEKMDGSVKALAISSDGKHVATGSANPSNDGTYAAGELRVWDRASGWNAQVLSRSEEAVFATAFSPDDHQVAAGGTSGDVRLWDVGTGHLCWRLPAASGTVSALRFSPYGGLVASGGQDGSVRLWNAELGTPVRTLEGHTDAVLAIAFSPDATLLTSASLDHTARVWELKTGECRWTLGGHNRVVYDATFSPDGRRLATASWDGTVKIWDMLTGRELVTLRGHQGAVYAVTFSPDGMLLVSGGGDGTVRRWPGAR